MKHQKNIIIIVIAVLLAVGIWVFNMDSNDGLGEDNQFTPTQTSATSTGNSQIATSTSETEPNSEPKQANINPKEEVQKQPARIQLTKTEFNYDILVGETLCGDIIGSYDIVSSDPSKGLYWGFTGAKPIWLTFSAVEGETPTTVEMTFNCILPPGEGPFDWKFTAVEKTEDGQWIDGYARIVTLKGEIKR